MFTQFEEGNLLSETREAAENSDESNDNSIITSLIIKEETDALDSVDESDHDLMSTEMLEDICDGSQSHPNVNKRDTLYKIRDRIKQRGSERKGTSKAMQNMGKGLYKVFKTVVKEILQDFPPLGEPGSEFSYFIPEPKNVSEVTKLSDDIKKPWIKATQKEINNLINNQTFLVQDREKYEPVTPCMDVYKATI